MVEALFPITSPDDFLLVIGQTYEVMYSEEFQETYFIFNTQQDTSLELKLSEEGNKLLGIVKTTEGTEVTSYSLQGDHNIGNLKEILTNTVGLNATLSVRKTVYEAGPASFAICKIEDKGYFVRLESYSKAGLQDLASHLQLDLSHATEDSLLSLAS